MNKNYWLLLWVVGMMMACHTKDYKVPELQIIPLPEKIEFGEGSFELSAQTLLAIPAQEQVNACNNLIQDMIADLGGCRLERGENLCSMVRLVLDTTLMDGTKEGYQLKITEHLLEIRAAHEAGLFYGVQTLRQLLADPQFYHAEQKAWELRVMEVTDRPTFPYRGMHLDVSRHFFSKDFVMRCLDLMAQYKMNRFHWHLTDAAGWRVEIKKYPELTEKGAWRTKENYMEWWNGDRRYTTRDAAGAYGGYYTQKEIREVVAYAAERQIMVIPEIEMPGHSEEVVSIYPELSCYGEPYRNGELCIGNEETFRFIENVLTEVMELFPSEYIHVGGDEASVAAWRKCPKCRKRMKQEGLKDEKELQSYLIHRVEAFLASKGRKLIGWDEILEGGLAPRATVMSWRGEAGGIQAAKMGHDVVMTPGAYCYFDSYQADPRTQPAAIGGYTPYLKVYSYHPVPEELTAEEARHILGAQANLWAEYIATPEHAEYMIFPRLLALAEVVWTPREKRETEDFKRRIAHHVALLRQNGVNAFPLSNQLNALTEVDTLRKRILVGFDAEKYRPEIHYTLNGGDETVYREPFYITDSAMIRAFIVEEGKKSDDMLAMRLDCHRAVGKKVKYKYRYSGAYPAAGEATLTDGLRGGLTYGDGRWQGFLTHVDVVVDLDSVCELSYVSANFMQLIGPGVYMPEYVVISVSEDGKTFGDVARINNDVPVDQKDLVIKDFTARFKARGRYVRLLARKHAGFQFIDEIVIY